LPTKPGDHHSRGRKYETIAAAYLKELGHDIVASNFRYGRNEIDIICSKDGELIFVEVKGGKSSAFGDPIYRVDERKRDAIVKVAEAFLQQSLVAYRSYRFDVVVVRENKGETELEHWKAAFTA
jgi:putative endonuclease